MRKSLCVLAIILLAANYSSDAADLVSQVITDTANNAQVNKWHYSGNHNGTNWSVHKSTLRGGRQEGVDVIDVDNGKIQFCVIPTRGMGILSVQCGDIRLGWDSPITELVHPHYISLESRGGLGWLQGFNEWMVRCGLEWAGSPGKDTIVNNQGDNVDVDLSLHGRIANIPASYVKIVVDGNPVPRIRIQGVVEEITFHGPKLAIATEINTKIDSHEFRISDKVTNRSTSPQEMQIIYHANFGRPILEQGAELVAPVQTVAPINETSASNTGKHAVYAAPKPGYVEEVYCIHPKADAAGNVTIMLRNASGDQGASIKWPIGQLPYLTQWKNTISEKDGYVTGLEPATGFPYNRKWERMAGRVPVLQGGASREFILDFAFLRNKAEIEAVEAIIRNIQGNTPPKVLAKPDVPGEGN